MSRADQTPRTHSRRALLTGRATRAPQIASLLVQARPERLASIAPEIARLDGAECHATDAPGRLIVTLEMDSDAGLVSAMSSIAEIDGVITASLVYHQIEDASDDA